MNLERTKMDGVGDCEFASLLSSWLAQFSIIDDLYLLCCVRVSCAYMPIVVDGRFGEVGAPIAVHTACRSFRWILFWLRSILGG